MIADRWQALRLLAFRRSGGRCQCTGDCGGHAGPCTARLTVDHFHGDHVIPRHPRDPRIPAGPDVPANVRALCAACNQRKSNRITTLPEGPLRRALVATAKVHARLMRVRFPTTARTPLIAPHVSTLRFATTPGYARITAALVDEVRAALNLPVARVYTHGEELRIEIPRWPRRPVPLSTMPRRGLCFGIGLDAGNAPVGIDLAASPHVLIAGQTGSGKSVLLQTMVAQLHRAGAHLVLVDADGQTFEPFARLASLGVALARDADAGHNAVVYVQRTMDERRIDPAQRPLVLVVDEIHTLRPETRAVIQDIAQRGRKRAVFVVVATHRPVRDVLTPTLTDQCAWRIAGRVQTPKASELVIGQTGAQHLGPAGDMLLAHGGHVTRFQAAMGGPADWARLRQLEAEPAPAPAAEPSADARYQRQPNDERVAHLVERYRETGARPSRYALDKTFGGNADRNRRATEQALEILNLTA